MRILHVIPTFQPAVCYGGTVFWAAGLIHGLQANGAEVRVLTTNADGPAKVLDVPAGIETEWAGIPVRYCNRVMGESISPSMVLQMKASIAWADVVHLTGVYNFSTFPCLLLCRLMGKPLVLSPHGALQRWKGSRKIWLKEIWNVLARAVSSRSITLHATATEELAESGTTFRDREWRIVSNGVVIPSEVSHVPGGGGLRVVSLGRLDPKKGLEVLLQAMRLLEDEAGAGRFALTIAGSGEAAYEASLLRLREELGLTRQVRFAGFLGEAEKRALFAASDVAVFPSHTENFGLVVGEALSAGVPVVVSPNMPWQDVVTKGCGFCVPNTPRAVADILRQAVSLDLRRMGAAGRKWMCEEYSWDRRARQMLDVYEEISRSGGQRQAGTERRS